MDEVRLIDGNALEQDMPMVSRRILVTKPEINGKKATMYDSLSSITTEGSCRTRFVDDE